MSKKISDLLQSNESSWFQDRVVANAPTIIGVFANFVVIFADYRAYDVVYQLTGVWWKALSASLACAVPFILWEIGWQYNHTTDVWRKWSLAMAGLAFATSIFLGVADFLGFQGAWADWLLGGVVVLTGVHTVVGFLYYYNDPDVARRRHKAQAMGTMLDQEVNAQVASQLLESGRALLNNIAALERQYDPEDVEAVMNILQGKKKGEPTKGKSNTRSTIPPNAPVRDSETRTERAPTDFSMQDYLTKTGQTLEQAKAHWIGKDYSAFAQSTSAKFGGEHIDGQNMRRIFGELQGSPNPTAAVTASNNGRR